MFQLPLLVFQLSTVRSAVLGLSAANNALTDSENPVVAAKASLHGSFRAFLFI